MSNNQLCQQCQEALAAQGLTVISIEELENLRACKAAAERMREAIAQLCRHVGIGNEENQEEEEYEEEGKEEEEEAAPGTHCPLYRSSCMFCVSSSFHGDPQGSQGIQGLQLRTPRARYSATVIGAHGRFPDLRGWA